MEIELPDGTILEAPEGADPSAVAKAYLAKQKRRTVPVERYNAAKDFGGNTLQFGPFDTGIPIGQGTQNFLAGLGEGMTNLGRGVGQAFGAVSRQDVADARARDAALNQTGAGKVGNVVGTVAPLLPLAFVPGANTLAGSAAIGAGTGALAPSASTGETIQNTALGGILSPAAILAGRGLGVGYNAVKSAVEPLTQAGQQRIAARALQSFAGEDPAALAARLSAPRSELPGYQPTAAEVAQNAGLSQLEKTLRANPEYMQAFADRAASNRSAVVDAINSVAGDSGKMAAAVDARASATAPLYANATKATATADAELGALLSRPSMQKAWSKAEELAAEKGVQISRDGSQVSAQTLQFLKMAMDDLTNNPAGNGIGKFEADAIRGTASSLKDWMSKNVPELRAADAKYAELSRPINQMEVGQALRDKLLPPLTDFGANSRLTPNAYAKAMRDGDAFAAKTLGRSSAKMADVFDPVQRQILDDLGNTVARRATADDLGKAVGSDTAQNLISQNLLRQILGPLGLPQSGIERAAQSTLAQTVLRPVQWAGRLGEQRVMGRLAEASLNPEEAAALLQPLPDSAIGMALWNRQGYLPTLPLGTYTAQQ